MEVQVLCCLFRGMLDRRSINVMTSSYREDKRESKIVSGDFSFSCLYRLKEKKNWQFQTLLSTQN